MEPTETKTPVTKAEHDEQRREALKKFGKLAAAAPAALVLLESRRSMAGPPGTTGGGEDAQGQNQQ
jgi:hypothetical protein